MPATWTFNWHLSSSGRSWTPQCQGGEDIHKINSFKRTKLFTNWYITSNFDKHTYSCGNFATPGQRAKRVSFQRAIPKTPFLTKVSPKNPLLTWLAVADPGGGHGAMRPPPPQRENAAVTRGRAWRAIGRCCPEPLTGANGAKSYESFGALILPIKNTFWIL